jgi:5-methyltetrahydrofolate--homocysteine methyltransferase
MTFLDSLKSSGVLVSDGATGTNLQRVGLAAGQLAEEWVVDKPDYVLNLHQSFVEAGSDILLTCTFSGSRLRLKDSPVADRVAEVNESAARLARQAADSAGQGVFVAGSMGPSGALMEPFGPLTAAVVTSAFAEQAEALAAGGVDLLVLETFFSIEEAEAAIEGVRSRSDLPLICSFSYDRGMRTMMGVSPSQMVARIRPLGVDAIGANCGTTPENMAGIVRELVGAADGLPVWTKPNAGVPEGNPPVYQVTPEELASFARGYLETGATVIGGCCGTTPNHVRAIAAALRT